MGEIAEKVEEIAAHTPGPWSAARSKLNDLWTVYAPKEKNIAAVHDPYGDDDAVSEANARLCAAAPDLLDALKVMVLVAEDQGPKWRAKLPGSGSPLGRAQSAIAKAEGRHG
jgi:hypothetical protein